MLRWPLPAEVLAANPELAQAALADMAQARVQEDDPAQMSSDTAAEPLHYRESTGEFWSSASTRGQTAVCFV